MPLTGWGPAGGCSLDVDLTERLLRRSPPAEDAVQTLEAADSGGAAPWRGRQAQMQQAADELQRVAAARGPAAGPYPRMPPRRGEAARWERSSKFAKRVLARPAPDCGSHGRTARQ